LPQSCLFSVASAAQPFALSTHFLFVIALLAVIHSMTGAEQSQAAIFEHPAGLNRAWLLAGNQLTVCVDVIIACLFVCSPVPPAGDAGLRKHFENTISSAGGSMRSVKVAVRKGPDGKPLSMGFGFVECSSEDVAESSSLTMQCHKPGLHTDFYLPFEQVTHCGLDLSSCMLFCQNHQCVQYLLCTGDG